MGVVYRAFDTALRRTVALKMLSNLAGSDKEDLERFRREAQSSAKLEHPNIVHVYEAGSHQGHPFIAMEYVEGRSFESVLKADQLPAQRIAEIVRHIALALQHAHEKGVIHRDVKPGNVLVDKAGNARLMDFGLARSVTATEKLTVTGQILGTPAFMAPEQALGDAARQGPWTDIYGVGAVLYRALGGKHPFQGVNAHAILHKILNEEPDSLRRLNPEVHLDLETIASRCMMKDTHRRYATAGDVAEELQRFIEHKPIRARPIGPRERAARWVKKNRLVVAVSGILLTAAIVMAVVEIQRSRGAHVTSWVKDVEVAYEHHEYRRMLVDCDEALGIEPENVHALGFRALAKFNLHDLDGAISDEDRTIALAPRDAEAWFNRGYFRELKGDLDGAISDETRAIELGPDELRKRALPIRGRCRERKGDPGGVIEDFGKAIDLGARDATLLTARAVARERNGDLDGAINDCNEALAIDRSLADAWLTRGMAKVNDPDSAIEDLSKAVTLAPQNATAWNNRGLAKERKREHLGAIEDFTKAIDLDSACGVFWMNRGVAREANGDLQGALSDMEQFLRVSPQSPQAEKAHTKVEALRTRLKLNGQ
jgi:tetratricopeptide (TPR) repeat protein